MIIVYDWEPQLLYLEGNNYEKGFQTERYGENNKRP